MMGSDLDLLAFPCFMFPSWLFGSDSFGGNLLCCAFVSILSACSSVGSSMLLSDECLLSGQSLTGCF
jgi:hypothetical protein